MYFETALLRLLAYLLKGHAFEDDPIMSSHEVVHDWHRLLGVGTNGGAILKSYAPFGGLKSFALVFDGRRAHLPLPLRRRLLDRSGQGQVPWLDENCATRCWLGVLARHGSTSFLCGLLFFISLSASSASVEILTFIFPISITGYDAYNGSKGISSAFCYDEFSSGALCSDGQYPTEQSNSSKNRRLRLFSFSVWRKLIELCCSALVESLALRFIAAQVENQFDELVEAGDGVESEEKTENTKWGLEEACKLESDLEKLIGHWKLRKYKEHMGLLRNKGLKVKLKCLSEVINLVTNIYDLSLKFKLTVKIALVFSYSTHHLHQVIITLGG
ncbi:hypothetical protein FNV43_RR11024 [Rhamnella rubrinervis]|uniref:Uncharacterized protein n=1 Tax=Rhamnella rubrinervis TaxID=2594499 RepID=A0A8K0H4U2_9ROSA|nr:hypothetical protein FNV43_RR11024 [Rhamnella rubrinervis]